MLACSAGSGQCHKASTRTLSRADRGDKGPELKLGPVLGAAAPSPGHERGHLRAAREIELHEDVADVVLHGLLSEVNLLADLAIGHPLGNQADDAPLLGSQLLDAALLPGQDVTPNSRKHAPCH